MKENIDMFQRFFLQLKKWSSSTKIEVSYLIFTCLIEDYINAYYAIVRGQFSSLSINLIKFDKYISLTVNIIKNDKIEFSDGTIGN